MRVNYGLHLQGRAQINAGAGSSAVIVPSATVSYYGALCKGYISWNAVTAGAMYRIREVDSATSNTVWVGYLQTAQGNLIVDFGDEGLKASATASGFHMDTDTAGSINSAWTGFQSRTNG